MKLNPKKEAFLNVDLLRGLLHYDPATGVFIYRVKPHKMSPLCAGNVAGGTVARGYRSIRIAGIEFYAHRLAWLYVYEVWPNGQIDHVNGDKSDNRISNLRIATPSQNRWNHKLMSTNTSGFTGVYFEKGKNRYIAQHMKDGRIVKIGRFRSAEEASLAYKEAIAYRGEFISKTVN